MSETDASDSDSESTTPIAPFETSKQANAVKSSRRDSAIISHQPKRTTLKSAATREPRESAPPVLDGTDKHVGIPSGVNPRKRRRSELFSSTSDKENLLGTAIGVTKFSSTTLEDTGLPSESNLFSPDGGNEIVKRGVLVESSPTRPSLIIPSGQLTRIESSNKPLSQNLSLKETSKGQEKKVQQAQKNPGQREGAQKQQRESAQKDKVVPDEPCGLKTFDPVISRDVLEFMNGLDEDDGGGRRTSRARKVVNYALPNLRDKMRREDRPEDMLRLGGSQSVERSVTPDIPGSQPVFLFLPSQVTVLDTGGGYYVETSDDGGQRET